MAVHILVNLQSTTTSTNNTDSDNINSSSGYIGECIFFLNKEYKDHAIEMTEQNRMTAIFGNIYIHKYIMYIYIYIYI